MKGMNREYGSKVQSRHLKRNAYLYVRQSTMHQVVENTESTARQYALQRRALALGWPADQVIIIDSDLGQSAASAVDRAGFQRLVAEVSMGKGGIVMGLEVSRLARNSTDWHRLLEICAFNGTLILDEDGVYDPTDVNDGLLLGMKGSLSEYELHILRARLRGGILNKARRGELEVGLPVGFVYDSDGHVCLDPDTRVQESIRMLFRSFQRTGSAMGTVKAFREQGLKFPRHPNRGPRRNGEVLWGALLYARVLFVLKNPRYAGAFFFGRTRQWKHPEGKGVFDRLPRDEWTALIPNAHEGYISWEEYEENLKQLQQNAQAHGLDRKKSPPREGPALLQGLAICAVCGERMTVSYSSRRRQVPQYHCQKHGLVHGEPRCQRIHGAAVDQAIGKLLVETVSPMTLEVALAVQQELERRADEVDGLRQQEIQRARYEAEAAQHRYMQVDPSNRLVADTLEGQWNEKLRVLAETQEHYEKQRQTQQVPLNDEQRARIVALATDFPRLWNDPNTPWRERKRMARLIIADVTLLKTNHVTMHIRFNGGATQTIAVPLPRKSWQERQTSPEVVAQIDRLLDQHTESEIPILLNDRGFTSGTRQRFNTGMVHNIRVSYKLKSRYDRLRERGMLNVAEMAALLNVHPATVKVWRCYGLLRADRCNDKNEYLYEPPGRDAPVKNQQGKRVHREILTDQRQEVQCET